MAIFRKRSTHPVAKSTTADLQLPSIEALAGELLRRAGLEQLEIDRVTSLHPTATPPNPEHQIGVGDTPNPWTLSCLVAEQVLWDTLNAYVVGLRLESADVAMARYRNGGLDALASIIVKKDGHLEVAVRVLSDKVSDSIQNPDHALVPLVQGYVREYWVPGVGRRVSDNS